MWGVWKPVDCMNEIRRLEYHPGFPAGINLRCPVLNGDKFAYISAAKPLTIPSLQVPLSLNMDEGSLKQRGIRICGTVRCLLYARIN